MRRPSRDPSLRRPPHQRHRLPLQLPRLPRVVLALVPVTLPRLLPHLRPPPQQQPHLRLLPQKHPPFEVLQSTAN